MSGMDVAALWVGLVVCLPNYYLAGGLVEMGMSWSQGIGTIFLSNVITLLPMIVNGHAGTKYGVPFPVLARAAFGVRGALLASCLRGLVACAWYGIQTWVGAQALHAMWAALDPAVTASAALPWLGISAPEVACFVAFWLLQAAIIVRGIDSIKKLEQWSAPILIVLVGLLMAWAWNAAGGLGPMLSTKSAFGPGGAREGQFLAAFVPAVTANVGAWATLSLNIPDFTRYVRSQRAQVWGQAVGLPLCMAAFSFVGLAVTSATIVIYGHSIPNPVDLLAKLGSLGAMLAALFGLVVATLSTNIAANLVAPANALVAAVPRRLEFRSAGLLAAGLAAVIMPWRIMGSASGFILKYLVGYSALLGPLGGIAAADYWILRRRKLDIDGLYRGRGGPYWYRNGWNPSAVVALLSGALPCVPGFLAAVDLVPASAVAGVFHACYSASWFVGFGVAAAVYLALSQRGTARAAAAGA
ncbi:unnamed protein product [Pedinophyceae sp. YPF-701]|nr:unnamed protein product [Pedinophyceae sp. YPF-701]